MTAEWTPEEERVAQSIADMVAEWYYGFGRRHIPASIIAKRLSRFQQPRWRDVRTDPPPRDGTSILAWIDGFGMGPMVLFWMDRYWREPANHLGLKKEPSFWQPITPPLPTAPEDRT